MNLLKTSLLISLIHVSTLSCAAEINNEYVSDSSRDCNNVAKQVKYVKPEIKGFDAYLKLRFGPFKIKVPPGYTEIVGSMDSSMIVVVYPNKSLLVISTSHLRDTDEFKNIDITQYPNILFMKTPCDKVPTNKAEQDLWGIAFIEKPNVFTESNVAMVTKSNRLTYYLSDNRTADLLGKAHIVDREFANDYLVMEARGIPYNDFKKIVLNITTWN